MDEIDEKELLRLTGIKPESFDQLHPFNKIELVQAVDLAVRSAKNPDYVPHLVSEAVRLCCEKWNSSIKSVTEFVVPPGKTHSPASWQHALSCMRKANDGPQEALKVA